MAEYSIPNPDNTPKVHPLVNFLSLLWVIPKREYLRRVRFGRTVTEHVAGNEIVVLPDVFNPVLFRTGRYFAEFLAEADLPATTRPHGDTARALDLGCGSGVLGLVMATRGFVVDGVDINTEAVRCARSNAERNQLETQITVYHGDLFEPVSDRKYDVITFSPPSFRGEPTSKFDLSWRSTDVFERFAAAVPGALEPDGVALVLQTSHGDEAELLRALGKTGMSINVAARKHFGVEILSIYRLQ
jgi:methylase of polypeptide subunit release factors